MFLFILFHDRVFFSTVDAVRYLFGHETHEDFSVSFHYRVQGLQDIEDRVTRCSFLWDEASSLFLAVEIGDFASMCQKLGAIGGVDVLWMLPQTPEDDDARDPLHFACSVSAYHYNEHGMVVERALIKAYPHVRREAETAVQKCVDAKLQELNASAQDFFEKVGEVTNLQDRLAGLESDIKQLREEMPSAAGPSVVPAGMDVLEQRLKAVEEAVRVLREQGVAGGAEANEKMDIDALEELKKRFEDDREQLNARVDTLEKAQKRMLEDGLSLPREKRKKKNFFRYGKGKWDVVKGVIDILSEHCDLKGDAALEAIDNIVNSGYDRHVWGALLDNARNLVLGDELGVLKSNLESLFSEVLKRSE